MQKVNVDKSELLKVVKENRKKHIADYVLACKGFRETVSDELARIILSNDGVEIKDVETSVYAPMPNNFEKDYDRIISMLEMSTDSTISLSAIEYDKYVRDEWQWSAVNKGLNHTYMAKLG